MDNKEAPAARKVKFIPKAPPRRKLTKATLPKPKQEITDEEAKELLRRVNAHHGRREPKVEKTSLVEAPFEYGSTPSHAIRTYGGPSSGISSGSSRSEPKDPISEYKNEASVFESISEYKNEASTFESDGTIDLHADTRAKLKKKEYKEPWDYHYSNYPTTLPLRRPYSGDPGVLDEAEFNESLRNKEYDETTMNPALELGLLEESEKTEVFFVQLPTTFPIGRPRASTKGKEIAGSKVRGSKKGTGELPGGFMGKMLVYKSGAVKLKLGDILHDVSPGVECKFAQDAAVINVEEKDFCVLGKLGKKMIVTPDIDAIMDSFVDLR